MVAISRLDATSLAIALYSQAIRGQSSEPSAIAARGQRPAPFTTKVPGVLSEGHENNRIGTARPTCDLNSSPCWAFLCLERSASERQSRRICPARRRAA